MTNKMSPPHWTKLSPKNQIDKLAEYKKYEIKNTALKIKNKNNSNAATEKDLNLNFDFNFNKNVEKNSNLNLEKNARVMYLCFLSHYYLELHQGDKSLKVLEGVLHIFPHSQIASCQVSEISFMSYDSFVCICRDLRLIH